MASARPATSTAAERMRRHRLTMEYALRHQLSLRQAEAALARQWTREWQQRVNARRAAPATNNNDQRPDSSDRWMMRD